MLEIFAFAQPLTVGELIKALSKLDPEAWVVADGDPVNNLSYEAGANEPFVVLSYEPE